MSTWQWRKWLRIFSLALTAALGLTLEPGGRAAHAVPQGGYARGEVLIQPEELKALLDRNDPTLKVIDVRHEIKYYLGHIPGAVQVWRHELENKKNPVPGRPITAAQMENLMGRLGISHRDTLIIYSDQFEGARLWWLLAYYGFPLSRMRLLDGGIEAWKARGYPTQLTSPRIMRASFKLPAAAQVKSLLATLEEVKEAIHDPHKVILDDRSRKQYLGEEREEGTARAGHIPGAVWVEWKETRMPEGFFKGYWQPAEEIRKIYADQGITPDKDIYIYSRAGLRATHSLAALYLVGYPLEKLHLYAGSWMEWSRSQEPIATGSPSPSK